MLPPELSSSVSTERFRREVHLAARLQHPHLVPLLSAGEADGLLYYTMPFVEGEDLRVRLSRAELQPYVVEARRTLERLSVERPVGVKVTRREDGDARPRISAPPNGYFRSASAT